MDNLVAVRLREGLANGDALDPLERLTTEGEPIEPRFFAVGRPEELEMVRLEGRTARIEERGCTRQHVLQLADVPGPGVGAKRRVRRLGDGQGAVTQVGEEALDELRQVVEALAKRRDRDDGDRETKEEVLSKFARADVGPEVAVRGGDDPHVDPALDLAADPTDLATLESAQEPRLEIERKLADFIEKERPSVRPLEERPRGRPPRR